MSSRSGHKIIIGSKMFSYARVLISNVCSKHRSRIFLNKKNRTKISSMKIGTGLAMQLVTGLNIWSYVKQSKIVAKNSLE